MFQSASHKMTLMLSAACLLMAGTSHAAVVNVTNAGPGGVTLSPGSLDGFVAFSDGATIPGGILSYTIANLTIDSDGVNNDTVTVSIPITAIDNAAFDAATNPTGTANIFAVSDSDGLHFRAGSVGNPGRLASINDEDDVDDSITFGIVTVSGTSSLGLSYEGSAVYTGAEFSFVNASAANLNQGRVTGNVTGATDGAIQQAVFNLAGTDTTITLQSITAAAGGQRALQALNVSFDLTVTAVEAPNPVPEPASLVMVGLGALCLLKRRK